MPGTMYAQSIPPLMQNARRLHFGIIPHITPYGCMHTCMTDGENYSDSELFREECTDLPYPTESNLLADE